MSAFTSPTSGLDHPIIRSCALVPLFSRVPLAASWAYFWYYAAVGAFIPFAALYYRHLGFDGLQVGLLTALPSLGMALLGPFVGALADARNWHRFMLPVALVFSTLVAIALAQPTTFVAIFPLIGLLAITTVPIPPIMDSYALTAADGGKRSYGSMRVWGSLGYMAMTLLMGRLLGNDISPLLLYGYATALAIAIAGTLQLPPLTERRAQPLVAGLGEVLHNRPFLLLLLVAYMVTSASALLGIYMGIHLEDLGASSSLMGLAFSISALSELPIIAGAGWFLRRIGPARLLALAMLVYAIRFALVAVLNDPAWVVGTQLLHGLSYGCYLTASVTLAHRIVGRGQAATAQSLLAAVSFGLGSITGALFGGAFLDSLGTPGIFRTGALVMAVTLAFYLVANRVIGLDRTADA
jgi:PPP family 3-phenylpropionic acid transporter